MNFASRSEPWKRQKKRRATNFDSEPHPQRCPLPLDLIRVGQEQAWWAPLGTADGVERLLRWTMCCIQFRP